MRCESNMKKRTFWIIFIILTVVGLGLRWSGIYFEGVDYRVCLSAWYNQLKETGGLQALAGFEGDYNLPYATALLLLTYIPLEPIISIKLLSIVFDFVSAWVLMKVVMECVETKKQLYGLVTYGIVLCSPITVINSGYLAQSDGIYSALTVLGFWLLYQNKPVKGVAVYACACAMKLQAVFAAPIMVLLYWCRKKFSALHIVWLPLTIQALCMPAVFAGCGWDVAIRVYTRMTGLYPFMYYYYPNIWTYFQGMPYYAFGKVGIAMAFVLLLLYCVLVVKSGREHGMADYLEYFTWIAMTCAMFLPCMHERYNYLGELLIVVLAVIRPKMRVPAIVLCLASLQCYLQGFFGAYYVSPYFLAACNIGVYGYLTVTSVKGLLTDSKRRQEQVVC